MSISPVQLTVIPIQRLMLHLRPRTRKLPPKLNPYILHNMAGNLLYRQLVLLPLRKVPLQAILYLRFSLSIPQ
jgi:hypothetical protein